MSWEALEIEPACVLVSKSDVNHILVTNYFCSEQPHDSSTDTDTGGSRSQINDICSVRTFRIEQCNY